MNYLVPLRQDFCALLAGIVALSALAGCASVPEFAPSKPIHLVQTVREGLFLCSEYQAPSSAKRITSLKPYLQCLDELGEQFEGFQNHPLLQVFYQELHARYEILNDAYWTTTLGREFETAIHATLRSLWRQGGIPSASWPEFSWKERSAMLDLFPKTAWMFGLTQKGPIQPWKTNREVEALLVKFLSLKIPSQDEPSTPLRDCSETRQLASQILYVHQLRKDLQLAHELGNPLNALSDGSASREEIEIEKRYHQEVRKSWKLLSSLENRKFQLSRCNFTLNLHR